MRGLCKVNGRVGVGLGGDWGEIVEGVKGDGGRGKRKVFGGFGRVIGLGDIYIEKKWMGKRDNGLRKNR